jgi:hypothetical protein
MSGTPLSSISDTTEAKDVSRGQMNDSDAAVGAARRLLTAVLNRSSVSDRLGTHKVRADPMGIENGPRLI